MGAEDDGVPVRLAELVADRTLTDRAFAVLLIAACRTWEAGRPYPLTAEELAGSKHPVRTVRRALAELRDRGYIDAAGQLVWPRVLPVVWPLEAS